ncbi:deoxyguanosinetriphosphate triphosphohydrolase [Candidatus Marinamargulisbacteria bacterium SCGC AAA071-K20]|nr:deoxyguanosinetriphosphate triphosphohydrolase [Candidatus Marinamargulisbacteria bacterium SCGC AAA071-K20]
MRDYLENLEESILAPYASKSKTSIGRLHEEPVSSTRTHFQRDRDRIIHSKAFRRLKRKTQVFIISISDHYRSRLTHTLEVSQLSRNLARMLRLNEDLVEAIALAHDLGHSPFGHAGERVLNSLMKDHGGFEHNVQSLRVVDKIENKYPSFPGLNLSFEVRAGLLLKHKARLWKHLDSPVENYNSLESQVTNIADEIAYNNHDIDDGISSEILNLNTLESITLIRDAKAIVKKEYSNLSTHQLQHLINSTIITMQIEDVFWKSKANIKNEKIETLNDVYQNEITIISFSPEMAEKNKELRTYLHQHLYQHSSVKDMNKKGQDTINSLFKYYENNTNKLPDSFKDHLTSKNKSRIITDYIAGMTDNYAFSQIDKISP